jgi:glycosyltransferase involved in cell wall biosynthesis
MTGSRSPEISVVIAAFNAESTLGDQLAALARQDAGFPFEVLVCDNGSTDGTAKLARGWADRLNLRVVDASARRGPGAARNVGAAAAASPLLAFCDADDVVTDSWLRGMRTALVTDEFVVGMCRKPGRNVAPGQPQEYYNYSLYRVPFFPQLPAAGAGNMGIRTDVFLSIGGFDDIFRTAEDDDLCWRVQLAGHRLVSHPEAVIVLRNRANLRGLFAQAYAHRAGERVLRHKYEKVIAAFRGLTPAPFSFGALGEQDVWTDTNLPPKRSAVRRGVGLLRRAARKLLRIRRLSDLSNIAYRLGEIAGARFGPLDRSVPQLHPPVRPEELLRGA